MGIQNAMADVNESFEGSFPPAGWQLYTTGGGWLQSSARSHSGLYSAYHNDFSGSQDGWLITPLLSVTNGDRISFWQNNNYFSWYTYHGLWVCTSGCSSPPTNWVELVELGPASEDSWEQIVLDLSAYSGQDVYLAFRYQGDFSDEWYVDDVVFPHGIATVTTQAVTGIYETTATGNGTLVDLGSSNPTAHGVCWATVPNPTIADSLVDNGATATTGPFTSALTGLTPNTTYYVRAYATNTIGTAYGDEVFFTTSPVTPTVTTQAVTNITTTTATGNGTIIDLGSPNPTAHGVCWNTTGNPMPADNFTDEGAANATGPFTSNISGLSPNTTYYVRAYAFNTAGTTLGDQVSFSTAPVLPPTYPVTYDGNGADSGTSPADQTKTHDVDLTLAVNTGGLARTGYTFAGWNTAADGSGTHYDAGAIYTANAALTLYAQWTAAIPAPIPTLSEWGMIIFVVLMAGTAVVFMRRRKGMTA